MTIIACKGGYGIRVTRPGVSNLLAKSSQNTLSKVAHNALQNLMTFCEGFLFRAYAVNIGIVGHPPVTVQVSMCAPDLDTAGVTGEIIVAQLANRLAAANVLPIVEEPLRPRATSLFEPAVDKDLGMDNRAEGVSGPLIFNHLV